MKTRDIVAVAEDKYNDLRTEKGEKFKGDLRDAREITRRSFAEIGRRLHDGSLTASKIIAYFENEGAKQN